MCFNDFVELMNDDSSSVSSISHFSESVSSDLIRLADWLISQSRDEYMNVYARVRANTLTKSMTTLKEYQKTGSAGSTNMAIGQTNISSPLVVCLSQPYQRIVVLLQKIFLFIVEIQISSQIRDYGY